MSRLLPVLAIMALFLGLASVAHAQDAGAPTVTEVAITSDPGDDDVYYSSFGRPSSQSFRSNEPLTVSVTFSEAVKGSGPLTIDVRLSSGIVSVPYAGQGPDTGQLLFTYSFSYIGAEAGSDISETGIEVVENSLALNGGSIVSQDDSTGADLAHPGVMVRHHQVNVPVIVFSNMAQAGATEGITVTADDSASLSFRVPARGAGSDYLINLHSHGFRAEAITLDIVDPSLTLDITVRISNRDNPGEAYTFAGAAAARGRQVFLYQAEGSGPMRQAALLRARGTYDLAIVGDGTGSVRIGATNSGEVDKTGAGDWLVAAPSSDESVPRVRFPAFATRTSYILHAEVLSSPEDGNSYRAGERIELLFTQPPLDQTGTAPPVAELWFGTGREHRREATLVDRFGFGGAEHLVYAYTVQSGDRDADGILVGENPLGLNLDSAYRDYLWEIPTNLALPAMQQGAGQEVDGSTEPECREVLCTEVIVDQGELSSGFVYDSIQRGYGLGHGREITTGELPYPYHNFGGISKATFRYGGRVYAIATLVEYEKFIKGTQDPGVHSIEMRIAPQAPETVRDRLALVVDDSADTRYPLGSAIAALYLNPQYYSWDVESVEFLEERVSVKIVELPVTATFDAGTYDVQEGESFQVRVSLGASFETKTVTLPLVATGENGATADDYSGVPEQLVFAPGETEKTFTVTLTQDDVDDDDEILVLSFGTLPDTVMEGGDHETATVSIGDDDAAGVSVSTTSLEMEEGDSDTYTVALTSEPAGDVTVAIGGVGGTDLSLDKISLTFTPGNWDTAQTVTVTAGHDDDAVDEAAVTVTHTVSSAADAGYNGVTADSVVVTVVDDEVPVAVSFGADAYTVDEGQTVTVTVSLSDDPERTVSVPVTTTNQGGATDADYSGVPSALTFNAGETSKTFTFTAAQDSVDDDGESVKLSFGTTLPPGVSAGTVAETTVSITDDDTAGVSVSTTELQIEEGDSDTYTVALDSQPAGDVAVAIGGVTGTELSLDKLSLTFTSGNWDTAQTVTVTAGHDDDAVDEAAATVTHTVSSDDDAGYNGVTADSVVVTVVDDEVPVAVSFGADAYAVDEGQTVTVTVSLSDDPERTVSVPVTKTNQGGATDADYSGVPENVVFNAGETSKTFTFTADDDDVDDDGESVKLAFGTTLPPGVSAGTVAETTVSITDDDTAGVSVSTTSLEMEEGDLGTYTVALTSEPAGDVTVAIGGVAGTELSLDKLSLTFTPADWDTAQTVTVTAGHDDDAVDEAAATVTHTVSSAADAGYNGVTADSVVVTVDDDEVPVAVSFGADAYTVDEGQTVTVTVNLDDDPERTVSVPVTTANQAGATDADYSGVPSALTFTAGETSKTFTFTAAQDDVDDDGESVKLDFGTTLPPGVSAGTVAEATVSITDDDTAGVSVSTTELEIEEGDSGTYTVALTSEPAGDVTVAIGGVAGTDLSLDKLSLTFTPGNWDTAQTVTVTAGHDDDAVDEAAVTVTHTVSSADDTGYNGVTADSVVVTVDDDEVPVEVSFGADAYTVDEGGTVTVTVSLDDDPERTVSVPVTTANQAGATDADYSGVPSALTFTAGETSKTFTFTAAQDDVDDDGESVKLDFGTTLPPGVSAGTVAEATVSITDDDTAGVSVSTTELEIEEGDSGTYTVALTSEPAGDVTVAIGGVAGTDLSLDKISLTFTPGNWDTPQTVTVTAGHDDDAVDEAAVTVTHTVSSAADAGYNGVTADSVVVTVDDDETASLELTLTMPAPVHGDTDQDGKVNLGDTLTYTATATNSGNVTLENVNVKDALVDTGGADCVSLDIGAACALTVTYTIAQADVDAGKVANTATATATGAAEKTATRETAVDQVEGLTLEKTATAAGFDGAGESIDYSYKVTNTGTVTLAGTLEIVDDKIQSGDVTCPAVPAGGLAPGAFLSCTGSYTTVQADVDAGQVTNRASASLGGVTSAEDSVTVNWRASQGSQPQLTVSSGEVAEDAGSFTFTVTLNPSSLQTITVAYATSDGSATSGTDYTSTSGTLTFSPGATSRSVSVAIADDALDESDETFTITLTDAVNAGIQIASGTATITDDDTAGVSVSTTGLEMEEGDSDTYTVVLDSQPAGDVTVAIGGVAGTDLSLDKLSLTFTPGDWDTPQTVTVTAGHDDDAVDEAAATITHTVSSDDDAGYNGVTADSVVVTVVDDEVPVAVSFGADAYAVDEGQTVTVTVSLSDDPERTVTVPITKSEEGGASSADYSGVPESVTFNTGEREKTFTFTAAQDSVDDGGESVKLAFGTTLPPGVSAGTVAETTVSITDDDVAAVIVTDDNVPSVSVEFAQSSYSLSEGGTVPVKVALNADPERAVTVPLTITNQSGATDSDYSGVPESITFASGEREKTFLFSAAADDIDEDDESVTLAFGTLPAGMSSGSVAQTTVNIRECKGGGIWCGTVDFGVFHQRSDGRKRLGRIYNNQMGELDQIAELDYDLFFYNGITYKVGNIGSRPSPSFWGTPGPPFNIPERASFAFGLSNLDGADALARITMPNEDYLDWTLYVSAEVDGETLEAELPFSEGKFCCDSKWRWYGLDLEKLNLAWEEGKLYRLRIVEDPRAEREPAVLGPPLYLRVTGYNQNNAILVWVRPQIRNDGGPPGVSYKIQWKETSGSWDTPADVSETMLELPPNKVSSRWEVLSRTISGLKWGIPYEARVIAVNEAGDSEPSNVVTFPKQPEPSGSLLYPQSATVDGATLVLIFDRTLDDNVSLPTSAFTVTVGGEPRPVSAVSVSGSTVTLTLASPVAAGETVAVDYERPDGPDFIRDNQGAEASSFIDWSVTNNTAEAQEADTDTEPQQEATPLTAVFQNILVSHDGSSQFRIRILFSEDIGISYKTLRDHVLTVTGGNVVNAGRVDGRNDLWTVIIDPDGTGDVTIVLPITEDCDAQGAICTGDGRMLSTGLEVTVNGPELTANLESGSELTASVESVPDSHNGSDAFSIRIALSEEPEEDFSYVTMRDYVFTVTGGSVTGARYLAPPGNMRWEITVTPDSNGDVTIVLLPTTDCDALGAVCTGDGRMLSSAISLLVPGPSTPATGAPAISGTAQAGQTLTADTSGIGDADGMEDAAFEYQWLADDAEIDGATNNAYALTDADVGKVFRVRVSFTDDNGNRETLTSQPTDAVAPRSPLAASVHDNPSSHDGQTGFTFELRFSEEPDVSFKTLRDHAFTVTGGDVTQARQLEQGSNLRWEITVEPTGDAAVTVTLPITTDCSSQGAICTGDGRMLSESVELTVAGLGSEERAANTPATGAPAMEGTARVGETLTAATKNIADADGMANATFSYQWLADDAAIGGATSGSYTLADADEGKAITVRVEFTDDAGNEESLTSEPTAAVAARPNRPATGAPTISGTAQVERTLTADTSDINDADGLTDASYNYQWLRNDGTSDADIGGATGATYTLVDADERKTIKVRVSFTDDRGHQETLMSAATGAVAAAPSPLTASIHSAPPSHDAQSAITFELRFSEEPGEDFSYVTLRDHAFTVTGGVVVGARRLDPPSNVGWEISVSPDGDGGVTIVLPATTDCEAQGAICTGDGRMLSNRNDMTVSGPDG